MKTKFGLLLFISLLAACKKPTSSIQHVAFTSSEKYATDPSTFFQFQNLSEGVYTNYWTFGDGTSSREQNPSHIYHSKGEFTVKLRVTSAELEDFITENNVIIGDIKAEAFKVDAFPDVMRFVGDDSAYANFRSVELLLYVSRPTSKKRYRLYAQKEDPRLDSKTDNLEMTLEVFPGDTLVFSYNMRIANVWQGYPYWYTNEISQHIWKSEPIIIESLQPQDLEIPLILKSEEIDDSFKVRFHHEVKYEPKEE
jgi:hypothetical protein